MNGTQILSTAVIASSAMAPTNWHIAGTGDFNNDGKSDILWRADDGSVGIWLINGTQILLHRGDRLIGYGTHQLAYHRHR